MFFDEGTKLSSETKKAHETMSEGLRDSQARSVTRRDSRLIVCCVCMEERPGKEPGRKGERLFGWHLTEVWRRSVWGRELMMTAVTHSWRGDEREREPECLVFNAAAPL